MMKLLANKKVIIGIVIFVVLIILTFILVSAFGGKVKVVKFKLPHEGEGLPTGFNPTIVSDELFTALDTVFQDGDVLNVAAYKNYLALDTDDMKVLVYNTFNKDHQIHAPDNLSLRGWINDEYYWTTAGDTTKAAMNAEFDRLNLS